ncbi:MAG: hypothetical protein ACOYOF_16100 [Verrucomicrobiaceae bacterium]
MRPLSYALCLLAAASSLKTLMWIFKSVLQHDIGDIGHLQFDNVMTTDVPNPISVGGNAKIGEISSTKKSDK